MANATLFRYKTETFVENNPNLYNSLMVMVDTYNNAALLKDIAIALGSAAMERCPVAVVGGFLAKYSLFAGVERLALWVCEHGAENLALYCAEGDAAIYASYLKTLDFVVDFAVKHGVCGALNKKLATANGYSARQFNLNKPHEFRSGKTSGGAEYRKVKHRKIDTQADQNNFWKMMKNSSEWVHVTGKSKPTLKNLKTGNFIQKSREKWEIEVYDKWGDHIGVIKPSDGSFHSELKVNGREMK